jgi:hypothetical protein
MVKPPKHRDAQRSKNELEDEPGAEQRFKSILKRALSTPPSRKQGVRKTKKGK